MGYFDRKPLDPFRLEEGMEYPKIDLNDHCRTLNSWRDSLCRRMTYANAMGQTEKFWAFAAVSDELWKLHCELVEREKANLPPPVPYVDPCEHDWKWVRETGRCLNLYVCTKCKRTWEVDSGD